jgi:hypothetical protein
MKRCLPFCLLLSVLLTAAIGRGQTNAPPAGTNAYFAAYTLMQTDAEEAVAALRDLVGDRGRIVYYPPNSRLLVNGLPEAHRIVQQFLREFSGPRPNVRIEVSFNDQGRETGAGVSVSGGGTIPVGDGRVVVGDGGRNGAWTVRPRVEARSAQTTGLTRQTILTQSGGEASINVGQEVPFVQNLVRWGRDWGYIDQTVEMRNVGASLKVKARVIGEGPLVDVTLTPELSGLVDGHPQRIRFKRVATSVTVADGATMTIGGFGENADFYRQFLAGLGQTRSVSDTQITLRVRIEPAATAP